MSHDMVTETIGIRGHDDAPIEAYLARPAHDRPLGDLSGAAAFLRGLPASNGRVGVNCSGGR